MFLPHIMQSTRVTTNSTTLIDNICFNIYGPNSVLQNVLATIFDHFPQFVIVPNIFSNSALGVKPNINERDWTKLDQDNFLLDYLEEDWNSIVKKEQASHFFKVFWIKSTILDKHYPLKKVYEHRLKFKNKPWITSGIQNIISEKNNHIFENL